MVVRDLTQLYVFSSQSDSSLQTYAAQQLSSAATKCASFNKANWTASNKSKKQLCLDQMCKACIFSINKCCRIWQYSKRLQIKALVFHGTQNSWNRHSKTVLNLYDSGRNTADLINSKLNVVKLQTVISGVQPQWLNSVTSQLICK